jgi:NAD(P)-dependent dehydrogenase (short-subunit alcohol dehydrogenase family)
MSSKQASAAKTVIVTGASQGIGAGLVKAFLGRGYNVVANSRNITKAGAFEASNKLALIDGNIAEAETAHQGWRV